MARKKKRSLAKEALLLLAATVVAVIARRKLIPLAKRARSFTKSTAGLSRFNRANLRKARGATGGIPTQDNLAARGSRVSGFETGGSRVHKVRGKFGEKIKSVISKAGVRVAEDLGKRGLNVSRFQRFFKRGR